MRGSGTQLTSFRTSKVVLSREILQSKCKLSGKRREIGRGRRVNDTDHIEICEHHLVV